MHPSPAPGTPADTPQAVPRPRPAPVSTGRAGLTDLVPAPTSAHPSGVTCTLTAETGIRTTPEAAEVGHYLAGLLRPATGYPLPVTAATAGPAAPRPRTGEDPVPGPVAAHAGDGAALPPSARSAVPPAAGAGAAAPVPGPGSGAPTAGTVAAGAAAFVPPAGGIFLLLAETGLGEEGYELDVTAEAVTVRAQRTAGLFYGVQTLRQLLPPAIESSIEQPGPWTLPGGRIADQPRYAYRGAMLDVSRHFFPVADVRRYLDHLARYKINHLHLHLTDDQGWRIAIDSWPRLAAVGGANEVDGGPGGYYTKDDYQEIVRYAAARHITIVPEIDVPGHTNAALTAYGELAPDGAVPPPYTGIDVGFSALAVRSDRTYDFLDDVLDEVAALTPGPYLHIGGDEAFKVAPADYLAFMNRLQPMVAARGKTVIGWHQIAVADHCPGRVIQFWGTAPDDAAVAEAVRHGARVVLSPGNHTYLDMKYSPETPIGKDWAGPVEVREAYDWDPGSYLNEVPPAAVLGVEAPLWTETVATMDQVEFMTFPRLAAVAEVGWSPASSHDWDSFRRRLAGHGPRWMAAGVAFHPSPQVPWPTAVAKAPAGVPADVPPGSPTRVVGPVAAPGAPDQPPG